MKQSERTRRIADACRFVRNEIKQLESGSTSIQSSHVKRVKGEFIQAASKKYLVQTSTLEMILKTKS